MWLRHWQLANDPFSSLAPRYVSTPAHEDAISSLSQRVASLDSLISLQGREGSGRRTVARECLHRTRSPLRQGIMIAAPFDSPRLLMRTLGRLASSSQSLDQWTAFADLIRVFRLEARSLIVCLEPGIEGEPVERFLTLAKSWAGTLSLIRLGTAEDEPQGSRVTIRAFTRSEAATYFDDKLKGAGRDRPAFTEPAVARLHAEAAGLPGSLDRLACAALKRTAERGERLVTLEAVQGVCREAGPAGWYERRQVG